MAKKLRAGEIFEKTLLVCTIGQLVRNGALTETDIAEIFDLTDISISRTSIEIADPEAVSDARKQAAKMLEKMLVIARNAERSSRKTT